MKEKKHSFVKELLLSEKLCYKIINKILIKYNLNMDTYLHLYILKSENHLYKKYVNSKSYKEIENILLNLGYLKDNKISTLGNEVVSNIIKELHEIVENELDDRTKDNLFIAETALRRLNKNMLSKV